MIFETEFGVTVMSTLVFVAINGHFHRKCCYVENRYLFFIL